MWKFLDNLAQHCRSPFNLTIFSKKLKKKSKIPFSKKFPKCQKHRKNRESLFTFLLGSADLPSIWRIFYVGRQKNFRSALRFSLLISNPNLLCIRTPGKLVLPQIFRGASSSKRMGCCRNISRDFKHNPLTSFSVICTVLPGRLPLTAKKIQINKLDLIKIVKVCLHSD